jgi:hypothetical protein
MVAGVETYNSVIAYEDIWVLTLPAFQWVKVHTRNGGRYGESELENRETQKTDLVQVTHVTRLVRI